MNGDCIALLRRARRMLAQGYHVIQVSVETGLHPSVIAVQRRLMAIAKGHHRAMAVDVRETRRTRIGGGANKRVAEEIGDLCDILAAPATRRDLRFAYRGDG